VGICRDGDGDKYSPVTEIEDGEYFRGRGAEKLLPLIPRSVDISTSNKNTSNKNGKRFDQKKEKW
jgi:hypothetical protein